MLRSSQNLPPPVRHSCASLLCPSSIPVSNHLYSADIGLASCHNFSMLKLRTLSLRALFYGKCLSAQLARDHNIIGNKIVTVHKLFWGNESGQKSCRTKFPNFRIFVPNFVRILPRIFPEFFEEFLASFRGKRGPEKISPKIPAIFQCKIPRQVQRKNPQKFSGERAK